LSNDASSGVETDWYIIDYEYFEGSMFTLDGYPEGMHTITWGARDWLGNNKTGNTTIVFKDTQSPITNLTLFGMGYRLNDGDNWNVTSQTTFNLTAMDLYSGVKFTWYIIDGEYFAGMSLNLSGYPEGMHTLTWGSMDWLGNNETGNTTLVFLDDSSPSTGINVGMPRYRNSDGDYWNVTGYTSFTLIYTDSYSGISKVWYTIDGNYFEGTEFNLSSYTDGIYTITWGSMDNLNNNEIPNSMVVHLDNTPPTTTMSPGEPNYRSSELHVWNVTQSTHFILISTDEYSDVEFVWYTIDGEYFEGSELRLTGRIDGLHNITWGAQDNLGNNETIKTLIVNVDTARPTATIYINGQIPPPDERISMNSSTPVTLIANDSIGVGIDYIWYSLDGGLTYNVYESTFTLPLNTSTIIYGARDLLGNNASSKTVRVNVDDREPVIDDGGDDDGDDDVDGGEEVTPVYEQILGMLLDLFLYIIIMIIVVILLALLLRRRKDKEEEVNFQTEAVQDTTPFQVMDDNLEVMVEIKEEVSHPSPPPPSPPPPPPPTK
ncbi:MAG: Ig-like domain-containing protein, partial [Thermoplasmata archaeon]